MLDLLTSILTVLIIIPIIWFTSANFNNLFSLVVLIFLSVPTVLAMVNGAPFVPTPMERVKQMVAMAKIKKGQKVYDLGCGDGRFVYIAANDYGAKATGVELSPLVYLLAIIRKFFWRSKAKIVFGNFKMYDFSDADVIFFYMLPETLRLLSPELNKQLKKGARIYSYAFKIPDWKLLRIEDRVPESNFAPVYVYEKV